MKSQYAIRAEHLSKSYRLGEREPYGSLRESISRAARAPYDWITRKDRPLSAVSEQFWALQDVSFNIQRGEAVGIIGRNGAGKSTLLKILSRITKPSRGEAALYGRVNSLLEVGTGFHPELTGRENIYLNGSILGMTRGEIDRKFDEIVDFAEIEQFLDTPVKRYSSGMYLRLAFSVAAHLETEILLVDEVLAVGDSVFQQKCLGKMSDVTHSGRTILFVSHNLQAIQQLCSRGILLDRGRLVADEDIRQVVEQYLAAGIGYPSEAADLKDRVFPTWQRRAHGKLRLSKCALFDSQGQPSARFKFGEQFTVYLEATSTRRFDIVDVGFFIYTNTSVLVCTLWNKDENFPLSIGVTQPLEVSIRIDRLGLMPGNYTISPWIESGQSSSDIIYKLLHFEILEIGDKKSLPHSEFGIVAAESTWFRGLPGPN